MKLVFEKLAQLLAAGQVWRMNIAADFVRIAASQWPVKVRILKAGRILGEMEGWQAGDYLRGVDFDAVEVENGANAQAVTVQIAGGGVGSDRVIGEVSIIDGAAARTKAGVAFFGGITASPVAGKYSATQLWNPTGSNKRIVVSKAVVSASAECKFYVRGSNVALESDATAFGSKLIGAAGTVAKFNRSINESDVPGTPLILIAVKANQAEWLEFREPIVIEEGKGLIFCPNITNTEVVSAVEFIEEGL